VHKSLAEVAVRLCCTKPPVQKLRQPRDALHI